MFKNTRTLVPDSDLGSDLSLSPKFFKRLGLRLRVFGQRLGLKSESVQKR